MPGTGSEREATAGGGPPPFDGLLRRLRLRASLTQEELAERSGLSSETISALERGYRRHPRRATLALLADALGLVAAERDGFVEPRPLPGRGPRARPVGARGTSRLALELVRELSAAGFEEVVIVSLPALSTPAAVPTPAVGLDSLIDRLLSHAGPRQVVVLLNGPVEG